MKRTIENHPAGNQTAASRRPWRSLCVACLLTLAFFTVPCLRAQYAGTLTIVISGRVLGASVTHPVYIALWDAKGFLTRPVQQVRIAVGAAPVFRFQTPAGRWALSAYEDVNGNGILDMGAFGPKEPSGFWRPFHGWRKPRFEDVAAELDRDTSDIEIRLGK
jgi:uncharacterized protein (DUF2141 family)